MITFLWWRPSGPAPGGPPLPIADVPVAIASVQRLTRLLGTAHPSRSPGSLAHQVPRPGMAGTPDPPYRGGG